MAFALLHHMPNFLGHELEQEMSCQLCCKGILARESKTVSLYLFNLFFLSSTWLSAKHALEGDIDEVWQNNGEECCVWGGGVIELAVFWKVLKRVMILVAQELFHLESG